MIDRQVIVGTDPRGALDTGISVGFALSIGGSLRNQRMG
jgi:hypothetical protein